MFGELIEKYGGLLKILVPVLVILVLIWALLQFVVVKGDVKGIPTTRPLVKKADEVAAEGFYGGVARGAGQPDCLRTLSDAADVYWRFEGSSDSKDLAEFRLLLSKWACLKKDLMSPSGIVEATRYMPYSTMHDRIPVPDIAGQCNSKTMPKRDLDITFETWRDRASYLFRRLCASAGVSGSEADDLEKKLMSAWKDVYDVATSQCLTYIPSGSKLLPRDAEPYMPDSLVDLRDYDGFNQ
jgi:hypothetical protein